MRERGKFIANKKDHGHLEQGGRRLRCGGDILRRRKRRRERLEKKGRGVMKGRV